MLLNLHMIFVFLWAVFLISFVKSLECKSSKFLAVLSLIFMFLVLGVGTKIMLMFPEITKSGKWFHIKLAFAILAMVINIYFVYAAFKNKKLSKKFTEVIYWLLIVIFILMYYLTLFKPL